MCPPPTILQGVDRRASPSRGGWHSAEAASGVLPGSCSLAPSLPLFKVTLAAYLHKMKFEEQVLDRHGPAQVGFSRRSDLTVYNEAAFATSRLSS